MLENFLNFFFFPLQIISHLGNYDDTPGQFWNDTDLAQLLELMELSFPRQKSTELSSFTGTKLFRKNIHSKAFLIQNSTRVIYSQPKSRSIYAGNDS